MLQKQFLFWVVLQAMVLQAVFLQLLNTEQQQSVFPLKKKEQKKAATKVSVRNVLKGKKDYLDNKKEEEESSGDAFVDGRKGMAGKVLDAINPMSYLKKLLAKFLAAIAPYLLMYTGLVLVVIVVVTILFQVLWPLLQIRNALDGVLDMFLGRQEWFMSTAMSEDEIESYLSEISGSERQKAVVRYALEQVGGWYDIDSLVYDSWMTVEKDLSFGQGYPLYAEELASEMEARNMSVDAGRIMPGDLIFYGDMSGGYLGIYHMAIYVGNGHVVEAMGNVMLMKMQTYDAVMVARPR